MTTIKTASMRKGAKPVYCRKGHHRIRGKYHGSTGHGGHLCAKHYVDAKGKRILT